MLQNDLTTLPWRPGQFYLVDNYWEAAGVLSALKAGIDPLSVRRPLGFADVKSNQADVAFRVQYSQMKNADAGAES